MWLESWYSLNVAYIMFVFKMPTYCQSSLHLLGKIHLEVWIVLQQQRLQQRTHLYNELMMIMPLMIVWTIIIKSFCVLEHSQICSLTTWSSRAGAVSTMNDTTMWERCENVTNFFISKWSGLPRSLDAPPKVFSGTPLAGLLYLITNIFINFWIKMVNNISF